MRKTIIISALLTPLIASGALSQPKGWAPLGGDVRRSYSEVPPNSVPAEPSIELTYTISDGSPAQEPLVSFTTVARYDDSTRVGSGTGAYQIGFYALEKLGYIRPYQSHPGFGPGNWTNVLWTGKDGVSSRYDFMVRHDVQDLIFRDMLREVVGE